MSRPASPKAGGSLRRAHSGLVWRADPPGGEGWFGENRTTSCFKVRAESLNCHSLRAPATVGLGHCWSDCPKTNWENPRMPGYQLLPLPPIHGKVQAALVSRARTPSGKRLATGWTHSGKQALSCLSWVQGGRKIVSQKSSFVFFLNVETVHNPRVCRMGAGSLLAGLATEDSVVLSRRSREGM